MEYYSAIKKNSFESVLMRWMKLESIIQTEVSQKDKDQYSILTHIYVFFLWQCWVFTALHRLSVVVAIGGCSLRQYLGSSLQWLLLLQSACSGCMGSVWRHTGSVVVARGLCGGICGAWDWLFRSAWEPPTPGLEPVAPALAGGLPIHCATSQVLFSFYCSYS